MNKRFKIMGLVCIVIGMFTSIVVGLMHGDMRGYEICMKYPFEYICVPAVEIILGFILVRKHINDED